MRTWVKQHSTLFFIGFTAFVIALAYGALTTGIFSTQRFVFTLRGIGLGFMAGGLALWAADERYKGGKPGLNPLLGAMVAVASLTLIVTFIIFNTLTAAALNILLWSAVAVNGLAMLIGLIVMIVNPAYEQMPTAMWPEGGEPELPEHHHHEEHAHPVEEAVGDVQPEPVTVEPQAAASEPAMAQPPEPDDLTRIEGIGPKANTILHAAGVLTFTQLAAQDPDSIRRILKEGGFVAPFDPTTWPQQAALAAQGQWDELNTLQDELSGGRSS
ncbi:MAG: hypothetical protein GYB64_15810 [Chloroflexi bacterium]|nr:hypothetical protein [Chloroflexota bacterium]